MINLKKSKNDHQHQIKKVSKEWGWVLCILCITYLFHLDASQKQAKDTKVLLRKQAHLEHLLLTQKEIQKDLEEQLASIHDPEWIEIVLKRKLGVVGENQVKVHFDNTQ